MVKWKFRPILKQELIGRMFAYYANIVFDYAWMVIVLSTLVAIALSSGIFLRRVTDESIYQYTASGQGLSHQETELYTQYFNEKDVRREMFIIENPNGDNLLTKSFLDELWKFHLNVVSLQVGLDSSSSQGGELMGTSETIEASKNKFLMDQQSTPILQQSHNVERMKSANQLKTSIELPKLKDNCDVASASAISQLSGLACLEDVPTGYVGFQSFCVTNYDGECLPPNGALFMYNSRDLFGSPLGYPHHIRTNIPKVFETRMWISDVGAKIDMENQIVTEAAALTISYDIYNREASKEAIRQWENELRHYVTNILNYNIDGNPLYLLTSSGIESDLNSSTDLGSTENLLLLGSMILLLVTYVSIANVSSVIYKMKVWPAITGLIAAAYGFSSGIGLCYFLGVTHTSTVTAAPFLVLSIGLDDMFVILNGYSLSNKQLSARERLSVAIGECGTAISITTLTNLIVFSIGASSPLDAIRNFCICTATGLFMGYVMILTFFLGWLSIAAKQEELKKRIYCGMDFCNPKFIMKTKCGSPKLELRITALPVVPSGRWQMYLHTQLSFPSAVIVDISMIFNTSKIPKSKGDEQKLIQELLQYVEKIAYTQGHLFEAIEFEKQGAMKDELSVDAKTLMYKNKREKWKNDLNIANAVFNEATKVATRVDCTYNGEQRHQKYECASMSTASISSPSYDEHSNGIINESYDIVKNYPNNRRHWFASLCTVQNFVEINEHPLEEFYRCNRIVYKLKEDEKGTIGRHCRNVFAVYYGRALRCKAVKAITLIAFAIYLGVAIYGCTKLQTGLDIRLLASDGSLTNEYYTASDRLFSEHGTPVSILFADNLNWCSKEVVDELNEFHNFILSKSYTKVLVNGYRTIPKLMNASFVGLNNEECSNRYASALTMDAASEFIIDFIFSNGKLQAFRMQLIPTAFEVTSDNYKFMQELRADIMTFPNLSPTVYHPLFAFYESDENVVQTTLLNMFYGTIAVLLVSLMLLPSLWIGALVVFTLLMIDVGIVGFLYFWDLSLSTLTMINLIIATGFSVDYSLHICHGFGNAKCITRDSRMIETLTVMGVATFHGAMSSLLGVSTLAFSSSFVLRVFFKATALVISLGIIHGLVLLPILLSLVGPMVQRYGGKDISIPIKEHLLKQRNIDKPTKLPDKRERINTSCCIQPRMKQAYLQHALYIEGEADGRLLIDSQPIFEDDQQFHFVLSKPSRIHYFIDATADNQFLNSLTKREMMKIEESLSKMDVRRSSLLHSFLAYASECPAKELDSSLPIAVRNGISYKHVGPIRIEESYSKCISNQKKQNNSTQCIVLKSAIHKDNEMKTLMIEESEKLCLQYQFISLNFDNHMNQN